MAINNDILREGSPTDLQHYFRFVLQDVDTEVISKHLIEGLTSGSLPPAVFSTWLKYGGNDSAKAVCDAMNQDSSILVREIAIQSFGRWLRKPTWREIWQAVGGTQGLLDLFSRLSVRHVKQLCNAIRSSSGSTEIRQDRQQEITSLLKALCHDAFPESDLKTTDGRPLVCYYVNMLAACTDDMIERWQTREELPCYDVEKVFNTHPGILEEQRRRLLETTKIPLDELQCLFSSTPDRPSDVKGVSQSMEFSIQFLQRLTQSQPRDVDLATRLLINPLLRRLKRRRSPENTKSQVLDLVATFLAKNPGRVVADVLKMPSEECLMRYTIQLWSGNPALFEPVLARLFKLMQRSRETSLSRLVGQFGQVHKSHRYSLMRLFLQYGPGFGFDIDVNDDLKRDISWPREVFWSLPIGEGSRLLQRIVNARGTTMVLGGIWPMRSIFNSLERLSDASVCIEAFSISIRQGHVDTYQSSQALVERVKTKATSMGDQTKRQSWAQAALNCSVASGRLDLLKSTLLWARRFNRDALTVKGLYSRDTVGKREWEELLTGLSPFTVSAEQLKVRILEANKVLLELLHTACMAVKEPSFYQPDWKVVLAVFGRIVGERLGEAAKVQASLKLDDKSFFDSFFQPTLDLLIQAERIGNQPGHEMLGFNRLVGPTHEGEILIGDPSALICTFIDKLAKERDHLWQIHRAAMKPSVMTLPDCFPKGLPGQYVQTIRIDPSAPLRHDLPYIRKRAEAAVFVPASHFTSSLTLSEDDVKAIGSFVDSYSWAIKTYLDIPVEGSTRDERANSAWKHVTQTLSANVMSPVEADAFWGSQLSSTGINKGNRIPIRGETKIPSVEDPTEPIEWNPYPELKTLEVQSRVLKPSVLALMLNATTPNANNGWTSTINSELVSRELSTVQVRAAKIWDLYTVLEPRPQKIEEALIASAMLYLNSFYGQGASLLKQPFPSKDDVRFPALYLDDSFIERSEKALGDPIMLLQGLLRRVPPSLLASLGSAMLDRLDTLEVTGNQISPTMWIVQMASQSDSPQKAFDLIQRVVVGMPDQSSWHRHLLNEGLLRRLPPAQTKALFETIVDSSFSKLQTQPIPRDVEKAQKLSGSPVVKISTIKLFAQILKHASFVDPTFTLELLMRLFNYSEHIDVKAAIIGSLISMLKDVSNLQLQKAILDALEKYALPIAASLNERSPLREEDWENISGPADVPEVGSETPVLDILTSVLNVDNLPEQLRARFITKILVPVIDILTRNHARWVQAFLKSCGIVDVEPPGFTIGPCHTLWFRRLIESHLRVLPRRILDLYADMGIDRTAPDSRLNSIIETLDRSGSMYTTSNGKRWWEIFKNSEGHQLGVLIRTLRQTWSFDDESDSISLSMVQNIVIMLLKLTVTTRPGSSQTRLLQLQQSLNVSKEQQGVWIHNFAPIVREVVDWIDRDLRTSDWQSDSARTPSRLPDTFEVRLYLLTYPHRPADDEEQIRRSRTFASELLALVREVSRKIPYHIKFDQIKTASRRVDDEFKLPLAIKIGSIDKGDIDEPPISQLLRVELAVDLLTYQNMELRYMQEETLMHEGRAMVKMFQEHEMEEIRRLGDYAVSKLSNFTDGWWNANKLAEY